jgi:site-specific DNA-methyltransferase (adenine-specific)
MDWATPQTIYDELDQEFHFDLDACANDGNAKCKNFITPEQDALSIDWPGKSVFMNPPYGTQVKKWIKKAYEESQKGKIVVCLLAARTDTTWFHDICAKGEIRFFKGRIKFDGKNSAPFPSMIVIFRPKVI